MTATTTTQKSVDFLNRFLADLHVMYAKLHSYHWNAEGLAFFTIHAKLEEYYEEAAKQIDEVAERILMLGARPISTLKEYLTLSGLTEAPAAGYRVEQIVAAVAADFSALMVTLREGIEIADAAKDPGTADLLTESLQRYEKAAWMLRAYAA
jgi:starvation-inducible DNA-binding protein